MRRNWSICREKGKRMGSSITMNGLSHCRAATKMLLEVAKRSRSVASVCEIHGVNMFLLGSKVAGFGRNWKIDASDEDGKPYL